MVKFVDNLNKDDEATNNTPDRKNAKTSSKKATTPNTNRVNERQASDSDQSIDTDHNKNDYGLERPPRYGNDV